MSSRESEIIERIKQLPGNADNKRGIFISNPSQIPGTEIRCVFLIIEEDGERKIFFAPDLT